jgi:hypothetical protein
MTSLGEPLLEVLCAIAIAAGPSVFAIQVAAVFTRVRVLYAQKLEILLPIGPFLLQRCRAETDFHPPNSAVVIEPGVFHIIQILISGDGTLTQRPFVNSSGESRVLSRLNARHDEVTHILAILPKDGKSATGNDAAMGASRRMGAYAACPTKP